MDSLSSKFEFVNNHNIGRHQGKMAVPLLHPVIAGSGLEGLSVSAVQYHKYIHNVRVNVRQHELKPRIPL